MQSIGLDNEQSEWIAAFVSKHGCLFEQWGVDPKTTRLLKTMHAQSWFSYGSIDEAIETFVGGRQGCKYGAQIFNSAFSVAILLIHDDLVAKGIVVKFRRSGDAPWALSEPANDGSEEDVLEVVFVDDTVMMLVAHSPAALDNSIDVLLQSLRHFYSVLRLVINWKPGKTEALLQYRGKGAAESLRRRRPTPTSPPVIEIPGTSEVLRIVREYKHLGDEISISGSLVPLAQGRRKCAFAAYMPL